MNGPRQHAEHAPGPFRPDSSNAQSSGVGQSCAILASLSIAQGAQVSLHVGVRRDSGAFEGGDTAATLIVRSGGVLRISLDPAVGDGAVIGTTTATMSEGLSQRDYRDEGFGARDARAMPGPPMVAQGGDDSAVLSFCVAPRSPARLDESIGSAAASATSPAVAQPPPVASDATERRREIVTASLRATSERAQKSLKRQRTLLVHA